MLSVAVAVAAVADIAVGVAVAAAVVGSHGLSVSPFGHGTCCTSWPKGRHELWHCFVYDFT